MKRKPVKLHRSSFVEENPTVCHSERSAESLHFKASISGREYRDASPAERDQHDRHKISIRSNLRRVLATAKVARHR